jgi:hypothetical protein
MNNPSALLIALLLPVHAFAVGVIAGDAPTEKVLSLAMEKHLAAQGSICLGKFDWPIEVSAIDFQEGTRDAVQMPVLEALGIVTSAEEANASNDTGTTVKRYTLTDAGRRYYIAKDISTGSGAKKIDHHRDLCPVRLSLAKITRWDEPRAVGDVRETLVSYLYKVDAADWTGDPAARKAFPMLERIIDGAGSLQLQQRMRLTKQGWVAVGPLD